MKHSPFWLRFALLLLLLLVGLPISHAVAGKSGRLRYEEALAGRVLLDPGECEVCSKENKNRPETITVMYISGGGSISKYQDEDKASCRDQSFLDDDIIRLEDNDYRYDVKNETILTIDVRGEAETYFSFERSNVECHIHTSCSVPIVTGDRIGPFIILQGNECTHELCGDKCGSTGGAADLENVECDICSGDKDRPDTLTIMYKSGPGAISNYQGYDYATCRGQNFPNGTDIEVEDYGQFFDNVKDGDIMTIGIPGDEMEAETYFTFSGSGVECHIHTSCSAPLMAGDQIGPFVILQGNDCTHTSCGDQCVPTGGGADLGECEICSKENKIRPDTLTMMYKSGQSAASTYQGDKADCPSQMFPDGTTIIVEEYENQRFNDVKDGDIITVGQPEEEMETNTCFTFEGTGLNCCIHTSCSAPIIAGKQIGPFIILEGNDCVYEYNTCGNDMMNAGEGCDPPGEIMPNGNVCRDDCTYCGDGITNGDEECDDGPDMPSETCVACKECMCEATGVFDRDTGSVTLDFTFCGNAEPEPYDFVAIYPCAPTDLMVTDQKWFDDVCATQLPNDPNCEQTLLNLGYEKDTLYPNRKSTWFSYTCGSPIEGQDCQLRENQDVTEWPTSGTLVLDPTNYASGRWAYGASLSLDPGCYKVVMQREVTQTISAPPYPYICKSWAEANEFIVG